MPAQIFGAQAAVTYLNRAFTNSSPIKSVYDNQVANAATLLASGADATQVTSYLAFAKNFGAAYAGQTASALSTLLMTNLNLLPNAALQTALTDYITANGTGNIGVIALQLGSILAGLESDTNYGTQAIAWNNEASQAFIYSTNAANTSTQVGDFTVVANQGQTFTLTTGTDTVAGNAGNDSINGISDGAATSTFNNLDSIDGGAGTDTITLVNAAGTMTLPTGLTVKNVENAVLRSAANAVTADVQAWTGLTSVAVDQLGTAAAVTVNTKSNATSASVSKGTTVDITDNGTGTGATKDVLATVSLNGNTGTATITSDALTSLSIANSAANATVAATAATRALAVTVDKLTGGVITDAEATSLTVAAANNKTTGITLTAAKAGTIAFSGDQTVSTALGAQKAGLVISSTNTAGVTITSTLNTDVAATGGAGKDSFTVGATTKTIDMGAGDDTTVVTAVLGAGGALNGGDGTDTLSMTSALGTTLSTDTTFSKAFSNYEKVSVGVVGAATTDTLNLSNLKDISYVVSAGTGAAGSNTAEVQTFTVTAGTTANVAEKQTLTFTGAATATGSIAVAGVLVNITNADATTAIATKVAAQEAAIKTANSNIASVAAVGSDVVITYTTTAGDVAAASVNLNAGVTGITATGPVETTKGVNAGTGNITVGGVNVAVTAGQTVDQVGAAIAAAQAAIKAGNANIDTVTYNNAGTVTVTYLSTAGDTANIVTAAGGTGATFGATAEGTKGAVVAGSSLSVTNMANSGTFELTGVIAGTETVALKDATGSADVLNIKLNGTANIVNTGTLTVASVETINIEATDSSVDTTTLTNPAAASTINLVAAAATKIVVTGNHGVNFTGSTLTNLTTLDASGVVSVGDVVGASAAQIATTGAVTFTSAVNNKAVTVTTGNGADVISVTSVNDATFLATGATASTISTGAGDDTITGSAGKDVIDAGAGKDVITGGAGADTITTGAGNDRVVLATAAHSTLAAKDVITDFQANTYGNGTGGAAGTGSAIASAASFTGDVIDLRSFIAGAITKVAVAIVSSESAATVNVQNVGDATTDTIGIALDSTTGNIYIDVNSDGVVDSVIQLTGVTTLTNAAFLVA